MRKPDRGTLLILTAPSGTGKSTLVEMLLDRVPELTFSVSYTTRTPRPHETNGKDYFFVDEATFSRMEEENKFLEYALVHGHHYGTSEELIEQHLTERRDVLLDVDVQGATQIMRKRPEAVSVFLLPPSFQELRRRLEGRGTENAETIRRRLERARREVHHCPEFNYIVVNDEPEETYEEMRAIIIAERTRPARRKTTINAIISTF
ncbi:MAG: guanylate kinase [Acidobacteria bacterium]|nr:guanylate kinase [Acidobacteriota bacterium]